MKRILYMFVVALGAFALSACGKQQPQDDNKQVDILDLLNSEDKLYQDLVISSKNMSGKMTYSVWLPNGYDSSKKYPFLYLLHGYESGDQAHLDRYWVQKGNAREIAKDYVQKGGVPMIIVMPNGLSSFYLGNYEKYLEEELMPYVEKTFGGNGKRAIAGLSMGGFGTLYHALTYPEKFTYAYAMSPAASMAWYGVSLDVMKEKAAALADAASCPDFTIEVGEQDTTVSNADSKELSDAINEVAHCEWISRPGIHYWDFWQECLPKALKKAGESF